MRKKIRLGVLFGGRSCEHEVSVTSARSMLASLDPEKYEVTLIGIGKDGSWQIAADRTTLPPGRPSIARLRRPCFSTIARGEP